MKIDGEVVVDATRTMKIVITPDDVKRGNSKDAAACAAALSCMRELKAKQARVHLSRIYVKVDKKWVRWQTPLSMRSEIIAFDRGGTFAPGEYTLGVLRPSERFVNKAEKSRKSPGKRDGSKPYTAVRVKRPNHRVVGIREHGANR